MRNVQRVITMSCVLIGVLVVVSTVSAFFSPAIQATLTVPPTMAPTISSTQVIILTMSPAHVTPMVKTTMSVTTPSPIANPMHILAQDSFQRANQRFWGVASDGQRWGANANTSSGFSIAGNTGILTQTPGAFDATLGPQVTDAEIVFSGSLSTFSNGMSNIGAVLHWTDTNNWYKAYIEGTQLILVKRLAGTLTLLSTVPFAAQNGQAYTLRFRIVGSMLAAKVWLSSQVEPTKWMVVATDTALPSGFSGLRLVIQKGATARITMFTEMVTQ